MAAIAEANAAIVCNAVEQSVIVYFGAPNSRNIIGLVSDMPIVQGQMTDKNSGCLHLSIAGSSPERSDGQVLQKPHHAQRSTSQGGYLSSAEWARKSA
ncbi:MAG: hypothetical protein K5799_14195 [Erythrobacter sp.]|nr:hypothetical protein [Erythrobacter sp.]